MKKFEIAAVIILGLLFCAKCTHFEIRSKTLGGACILMDIDAIFYLTYTENNHTQVANSFDLKGASVIDGSCQCGNLFIDTTSVLSVIIFPSKEMLMFNFNRQNNTVDISMRFSLNANKHFRKMNSTTPVQLYNEQPLPLGMQNNSYKCISEEKVNFKRSNNFGMMMMISNLHVQAYEIRNSVFGPFNECSQDFATSTPQSQTSIEPQNTTTPETTTESTTESLITTTEPSSNMTTEPNPETTTHSNPETTTHSEPETTTTPDNSTTPESEATTKTVLGTSQSLFYTTTQRYSETTSSITVESTTSRPQNHHYVVRNVKEVCIVLQADITFEIPYQKLDGSISKNTVGVPYDVNVSGYCSYSASSQEIKLAFFNSTWTLSIVIAKNRKSGVFGSGKLRSVSDATEYFWQSVILTYVIDNNFPDAVNKGTSLTTISVGVFGRFVTGANGSYKCNSQQYLEFGVDEMVKINISNMQYRAFGHSNSTAFLNSDVSKCPMDDINDGGGGDHKILSITLGCAFAGLVVIMVVACGITLYRKRKHERKSSDHIDLMKTVTSGEVGGNIR